MEEEEQVWVAGLGGSAPAFEAWQVASGKAIVVVRCTAASWAAVCHHISVYDFSA